MATIEVILDNNRYLLKADESEDHLREVAEMVLKKIGSLKKQKPGLSLQKAAILAAFDFASLAIQGKKKALSYQTEVLQKAHGLLNEVEAELSTEQTLQ